MRRPTGCVVIVAHNRPDYLERAVRSALNQDISRSRYDVIVSKNFSIETQDQWLSDSGVRVLLNDSPLWGAMADKAIRGVAGDVILFLDDDDEFDSHKLGRVLGWFETYPSLGYVHNAMRWIDDAGCLLPVRELRQPLTPIVLRPPKPQDLSRLRGVNADMNNSCISISRRMYDNCAGNLPKLAANCDEFLFYCALTSGLDFVADSAALTSYRVHASTSRARGSFGAYMERKRLQSEGYFESFRMMTEASRGTPFEKAAIASAAFASAEFSIATGWKARPGFSGKDLLSILSGSDLRSLLYRFPAGLLAFASRLAPVQMAKVYYRFRDTPATMRVASRL